MKRYLILVLFVLVSLPGAVAAGKSPGKEDFRSIDELAATIIAYFPRLGGEVAAVQGQEVTITLGKKSGIKPGMILTLWREGKEIIHPVTGAAIGREEDEVGSAAVVTVGADASTAVIRKQIRKPGKGDRARTCQSKVTLAILQFPGDRRGIAEELADPLDGCGRFTVLDSKKAESFLEGKNQRDSALIREMGRRFGLDAVVVVGNGPPKDSSPVTVTLFHAEDGSEFASLTGRIRRESGAATLGEIKPFFMPRTEGGVGTPVLPIDALFFVSADLDRDGTAEHVFSDGSRLYLYHENTTGWREIWTEPAAWAKKGTEHLYLDAADINGNGKPEIFLTTQQGGTVTAAVIEMRDGNYRRIAEVPGFLRVIDYPGRGPVLIGQDFAPKPFFTGTPKEYAWSGNKYAAGPAVHLPKGVTLYGFVFAEVGEPRPVLIALDASDRVQAYSGDSLLWKSEARYPGSYGGGKEARIKGRILAFDSDGDGRDEIILQRNGKKSFLGGETASQLHCMQWTGERFEPKGSRKDIPGAALDIRANGKKQGDMRIRALLKVPGGLFKKDRTKLMFFPGTCSQERIQTTDNR